MRKFRHFFARVQEESQEGGDREVTQPECMSHKLKKIMVGDKLQRSLSDSSSEPERINKVIMRHLDNVSHFWDM
jgi:hypothetical protein